LHHFKELAFLELYRFTLATLFLEVLGHDVHMVWEGFSGEEGDEGRHWRGPVYMDDRGLIVGSNGKYDLCTIEVRVVLAESSVEEVVW
jgi:hypothetical protein